MYLQEQIVDGAPIGEQGRYVNHYDIKLQPVEMLEIIVQYTIFQI